MPKRFAMFDITPEYLSILLQLPEGATLRAVDCPADRFGVMRIVVEGVGWETYEGQTIHQTVSTITDGKIDWHLPEER